MNELILLHHGNDDPIRCTSLDEAKNKAIAIRNTKEDIYVNVTFKSTSLITKYKFHDNELWESK